MPKYLIVVGHLILVILLLQPLSEPIQNPSVLDKPETLQYFNIVSKAAMICSPFLRPVVNGSLRG